MSLASLHIVRRRAAELLDTDAIPVAELVDRLVADGLVLGRTPGDRVTEALEHDPRFVELADERWVHVPSLLHGTTWSVPVDAIVASSELLPCTPDLELFSWWGVEHSIDLADGSGVIEVVELDDGRDAFAGPDGWLDARTGATLLVRMADGQLALDRVDSPPVPTPEQVTAVQRAFARGADTVESSSELLDEVSHELTTAMLDDVLAEALVVDRDAFLAAPVPPVDALLGAAGLERAETTVAEVGCDWDALGRWRRRTRLAYLHDLDEQEGEALELVLDIADEVASEAREPLGSSVAAPSIAMASAVCLSDPSVARAFLGELNGAGMPPEATARFARLLLEHLEDDDVEADNLTAGARWVLARALDHQGHAVAAEAELERAVAIDPDFPLARTSLAAFAGDRGDALRALSLLEGADVDDDDPLLIEVVGYALRAPATRGGPQRAVPVRVGPQVQGVPPRS